MLKLQMAKPLLLNMAKRKSFGGLPASILICLSLASMSFMTASCQKNQEPAHVSGDSSISDGAALHLGALPKEEIQRVVQEHAGEIKACYESGVAMDEELSGKLEVSFIIDLDGSVSAANIESTTLNHVDVENCVIGAIKSWNFPAPQPSGMVQVTYPFAFGPVADDDVDGHANPDVVLPCEMDQADASHAGALPKEEIQRVVRQHADDVRLCYESALAKVKDLRGKIDVAFVIAIDGSVSDAQVKSTTINHADVENCVIGAIKSWKFPAPQPSGSVKVNYPFVFEPESK